MALLLRMAVWASASVNALRAPPWLTEATHGLGRRTASTTLGAITAGTLNATAQTGVTLTSPANQITTIGADTTASGPNQITQ